MQEHDTTYRNPLLTQVPRIAGLFAAIGCATSLGCTAQIAGDEEVASTSAAVQYDAQREHYDYVREDSLVARSTGSIQAPFLDREYFPHARHGAALRGTCGVTFISPHYAVTAAHCVDEGQVPLPDEVKVTVELYDIQNLSSWALAFSSIVQGSFPNYERPVPLEDMAGYEVESHECSVHARCAFGAFGCSFGADIALIHCPTRTSTDYMPTASSAATTGPVEMYWFHEVLNISSEAPRWTGNFSQYLEDLDRHRHYTLLNAPCSVDSSACGENYHYHGSERNALLPLHSTPWSRAQGGGERQRIGGSESVGARVRTDLFGCHGSSGSGVFQRNRNGDLELLGPVSGGGNWASTRLCNDPNNFEPGDLGLTYTSNASTRRLQSDYWRILFRDRQVLRPPGPVLRRSR